MKNSIPVKSLLFLIFIILINACSSEYFLTDGESRIEFRDELTNRIDENVKVIMMNDFEMLGKLTAVGEDYIVIELSNELSDKNEKIKKTLKSDEIYAVQYYETNGQLGGWIGLIAGGILGGATGFVQGDVSNSGPHPNYEISAVFGAAVGLGLGIALGHILYVEDIFYFHSKK